jgi:hypothetical protein
MLKLNSIIQKIGISSGKSSLPAEPPVLGPAIRFPYGAFQLKARITKGAAFDIQASSDLKLWTTIHSDTAIGETLEYVDPDASKFSYRFYRILIGDVQSANVMGYSTTTLPPGFSMIANPFDAGNNSISELLKDLPDGAKLNKFDTRFFQLTENFFRGGRWSNPNEKLAPGEGAIVLNPTSDYKSLSFVGNVMQGNLSVPVPSGFSIRSSLVPQPGRLHADLGFPIAEGDVIHLYDRDRQKYILYPYDAEKWAANPPIVSVGESFWVAKTSPGNWTRSFFIK